MPSIKKPLHLLLLKIAVVVFIPGILLCLYLLLFADGRIDAYYLRFTSPRQQSLVIGTSRAAQGIIPGVMNAELRSEGNLYNYSFTAESSPFGYYYLESIRRKLSPGSKDGIFIVCVDPWSVSAEKDQLHSDADHKEKNLAPYNVRFPYLPINVEYLYKNYTESWYTMMLKHYQPSELLLHKDGWLEVSVPMDSSSVRKRTEEKLKNYRNKMDQSAFSPDRFSYLEQTVKELQQHGRVFLVRIPVSAEIRALEDSYMPGFDNMIDSLASGAGVTYFPYPELNGKLSTTDANHLYKDGARTFSLTLAAAIRKHLTK